MSWEGVGGVKLARAWLEHAERAAGLGFWSWTCNTQEVVWSREVYRILGIEPRPSHESVELAFVMSGPMTWSLHARLSRS